MATNRYTLAHNIVTLRKQRAWSLRELARRVGIPTTTLHSIEMCEVQDPGAYTVARIARVLRTTSEALLGLHPTAPAIDDIIQRNTTHDELLAFLTVPWWERKLMLERHRLIPPSKIPLGYQEGQA